jgi:cytochrome c oxidase assembly protein subunit 19
MASNVFGAKQFKGSPPEKGSFPLDHDGECKAPYLRYMVCLSENKSSASVCRLEAKDYLSCRMEKGLMAKEEWNKLGFNNEEQDEKSSRTNTDSNNKSSIKE